DHIIAKSRGGQDVDDNIQLLCGNCNSIKGDRGMHYLWRKILERRSERAMREYKERRRARARARQR
ncbi:MAG: HNH endonuclease signature motif containing protein, partial [Gammaproteobacteria bacterium]